MTTTQPRTTDRADVRRLQRAMAAAGIAALALMYGTQALLPPIGATFGVGATAASLTVSVTTGVLALAVLPMSGLAERHGRTRIMTIGLAVACLSQFAGALAPDLPLLLAARAVDGLALAGVVAVAMGHLGAELEPRTAARAIGVYVSATTIGGLVGRLVPAGVSEFGGWRLSLGVLAVVGGVCVVVFAALVPAPRVESRPTGRAETQHLHDPGIVRLCLVGMLLMGGFVATYNYLTYRLAEAPFGLPTAAVGLIFLAYLAGTVSSTMAGRVAATRGPRRVLLAGVILALAGLATTIPDNLACVIAGLVVFTGGFFTAHSVASSWVTTRAATATSKASALYLTGYYLGSSLGGSLIGLAWTGGGWPATVAGVGGCYLVAALVAVGIQPRTEASTAAAVSATGTS